MSVGKEWIANAQFHRGTAFLAAAVLLDQRATTEPQMYVVLHLTCQSIECSMKGLLLAKDFDRFRPQEKPTRKNPNGFGHQIVLLVETTLSEYKLNPLRGALKRELADLGDRYAAHELRYAGITDIFFDPRQFHVSSVTKRLHAMHRLIRKIHRRDSGGNS